MRMFKFVRWAAALALATAPLAAPAKAQDAGTVTLHGVFHVDEVWGSPGADLTELSGSANDHTWTLTMYGTTWSHSGTYPNRITELSATSFDLEFSGPDAQTLNQLVGDQLAGGDAAVQLRNYYNTSSSGFSTLWMWITPPGGAAGGISFGAADEGDAPFELFPADGNGYPVVSSEPYASWVEETYVSDGRAGSAGLLISWYGDYDIAGDLGTPVPVQLRIGDGSVVEGDRGSAKLTLGVSLTNASDQTVSVGYRTVDGSAVAKADYSAAGGTLTFQPGEISKAITLKIKSDRKAEPDETFTVELFGASGATIEDGLAVVTIVNDD